MQKQIYIGEAVATYKKGTTTKKDAPSIKGSKDGYELLKPFYMDEEDREAFSVIFLNRAHKVILIEKMFTGGISATTVDVRLILKKALLNNATSIIVRQNGRASCRESV